MDGNQQSKEERMVQDVIKKIHWLGHDGFRIDSDESNLL